LNQNLHSTVLAIQIVVHSEARGLAKAPTHPHLCHCGVTVRCGRETTYSGVIVVHM
jgi:hypothetical protein